jgi:predicted ABC-type ATPase
LHAYLNADEIAREISPHDVEAAAFAAGRRMIERMRMNVARGVSFAFETTCAGRTYLPLLERCKRERWRIRLLFFWLPSARLAEERVAQRVLEGGHRIPPGVIQRRYKAGISNMRRSYLPLAEDAEIYDNSTMPRILVAEKREGKALLIHDAARWARIEEAPR